MSIMNEVIAQLYSLLGVLTFVQNLIPHHVWNVLNRWSLSIQQYFNLDYHVITFPQPKGRYTLCSNIFGRVNSYLANLDRHGCRPPRALVAVKPPKTDTIVFYPGSSQIIHDYFQEKNMWWTKTIDFSDRQNPSLTLKMASANKSLLQSYLEHIKQIASEHAGRSKDISLSINHKGKGWTSIIFDHPCTFDCLALDPALKENIKSDLDEFKQGMEFYKETGRPWKRGYLIHGPPGTGKSSLVAAIANYLRYDLYELELKTVKDNDCLVSLLSNTRGKSIIVIEDIDSSLDPVTLSRLLDFTEGLCASLGEERIIIFTTNHPDHLDPALLRPGRMDIQVELSFCNFPAFIILAKNYLDIEDHQLYAAVEGKMAAGTNMVPVDIIEILLTHLDNPSLALNSVVSALDDRLNVTDDIPPPQSYHGKKTLNK